MILASLLLAATVAHPKNIILLVADGAGPAHFTAAKNLRGENFRIGTMPVVGLHTTHCADRAVTDSAAGATAFAAGAKTNYESLSVDPKTLAPLPTVLEEAEKLGKATGLVTTSNFWDATPAAFAAHAKNRRDPGVDLQMLRSGADVIAGTGEAGEFASQLSAEAAKAAAENGYTVVRTRAELDGAKGPKVLAYLPYQERNLDVPEAPLPLLAQWAIDRLADDPEGFFLLIEHEGTDSCSHQNNQADLRKALTSFDEAVGVALDFARKRGDTLVVVTADHETGGLRISETKTTSRWRLEWSDSDHTATAVPVFAYGPGSGAFAGFQDNTDVGRKLRMAVVGGGKN
ncbi:MAG TPA: alkaline phosphatase [Thermoanaerobaculia bacterium]|nr:alkaline phosphatase [Thermoanaerobaculia bacterium]